MSVTEIKTAEANDQTFVLKIELDAKVQGLHISPSALIDLPRTVEVAGKEVDLYAALDVAIKMRDMKDPQPGDGEADFPVKGKTKVPLLGSVGVDGMVEVSVRED